MTLDRLRALRETATPGPWYLREDEEGLFVTDTVMHDVRDSLEHGFNVILPHGEDCFLPHEEANLRLAALAPCLVDALIEAHEALSRIDGVLTTREGDNVPQGETPKMHARQLARAAVARIERLDGGTRENL